MLDLSKLHMVDFHYKVTHDNFQGWLNLIHSDTDTFMYSIQHEDIYEWIKENKNYNDLCIKIFEIIDKIISENITVELNNISSNIFDIVLLGLPADFLAAAAIPVGIVILILGIFY